MIPQSLRSATPRLAVSAAVLGLLYDAPHLLFDRNYATASDHPLFVLHAVAGIATCLVLALVLGGLLLRVEGRISGALPIAAGLVTLAGLFLVAGGTWAEGFMVPYFADIESSVFNDEVGGSLLGVIVLGGVTFAVGWLLTAVVLRRAGILTAGSTTGFAIACILAIVPLPLTTFLFTAALAVVTRRLDASPVAASERWAPAAS